MHQILSPAKIRTRRCRPINARRRPTNRQIRRHRQNRQIVARRIVVICRIVRRRRCRIAKIAASVKLSPTTKAKIHPQPPFTPGPFLRKQESIFLQGGNAASNPPLAACQLSPKTKPNPPTITRSPVDHSCVGRNLN